MGAYHNALREEGSHGDMLWALEKAWAEVEGLREAAVGIRDAWEVLPGGRAYPPREIKVWLTQNMKPAIDKLIAALARPEKLQNE